MIPFNRPALLGREMAYVRDAIARGHLSGDGTYTRRCESFLESYFDAPRVLLTSSGTHALELAALLLHLRHGDEFLVPSFTFSSTANAFMLQGLLPRFVDIRRDTLNMDEQLIPSSMTRRTRLVVPIHYGGVPAEMATIVRHVRHFGLHLVEDAAQAIGARYRGKRVGSFGELNALSFHETKNISCGEGGALILTNEKHIRRAEVIRQKGTNRAQFYRGEVRRYSWVDVGSSYVPSELQSAFLAAQLQHLSRVIRARAQWYRRYREELQLWQDRGLLTLPTIPSHVTPAFHTFYIVLNSHRERETVRTSLLKQGILAVTHYEPLHLSRMGRHLGYRKGQFPVTEDIAPRLLRLPLFNGMNSAEHRRVIAALHRILRSR